MSEFTLTVTPEDNGTVFLANTDIYSSPAVGGFVLYLQNTAEKEIEIQSILVSAGEFGGELRWYKGVEVDIIVNAKEQEPIRLSGNGEAEVVCYKWDGGDNEIAGISGGGLVKPFILGPGYTPVHIKATLGMFDNIALHYTPTVGSFDFECGILFSQDMIDGQ